MVLNNDDMDLMTIKANGFCWQQIDFRDNTCNLTAGK